MGRASGTNRAVAPTQAPTLAPLPAPTAAPAPAPTPAPSHVPATSPADARHETVLLGSSRLPATMKFGDADVALGVVVAAAHSVSGLSVAEWNDLEQGKREELLDAQVERMRGEADAAAVAAQRAAAQAREAEEARRRATEAARWPMRVHLRNDSSIALSEPISGAYLQAGGTADVVLQDAEHAQRVMQAFEDLLDRNYIPHHLLKVDE